MFNVKFLAKIAARSDYQNRHVSLVLRGGALLASAYNYGGTHSEVRALKKLWPSKREGVTLINLRLTFSGQVGLSKPCLACLSEMKAAGVSKVYYTNNSGDFIMERV